MEQWNHKVFDSPPADFEGLALELFALQYRDCAVYRAFSDAVDKSPASVKRVEDIPFLPVRFFKSHQVLTTDFTPQAIFESSGTSGMVSSRHWVKDISLYEESFTRGFELFYGSPRQYCVLGLLPSYLERNNSSLVYMVDRLVQLSEHSESGFYLYEHDKLFALLQQLEKREQKTMLIGVSFALLDFAEKYRLPLKHTMIMETGGMKGRREELVRAELHEKLKQAFGLPAVHSEYGMTELLSQAYAAADGIFRCPPWMKMLVREEDDPFLVSQTGKGTLNIIDLANRWSCAFLATDDAGHIHAGGSFEVLGRVDGSDLRGCSLLVV